MSGSKFKFSLIMATLGRDKEIEFFFESLLEQSYINFEVIVIDQNKDKRVNEIVEKYEKKLCLKYIKSDKLGLSYNRNLGLKNITGNIIAFPDDDCAYMPETLEKIYEFFKTTEYQIYSCGVKDFTSENKFRFLEKSTEINFKNLMKVGCSITYFIKLKDEEIFYFDEKLGVGAKFGACEETDYISELLSFGYSGYYNASSYVLHEIKQNKASEKRYYTYGLGFGAFSKKEILLRKNLVFILYLMKIVLKSIVGILIFRKKRIHQYNFFKGIILGLIKYK